MSKQIGKMFHELAVLDELIVDNKAVARLYIINRVFPNGEKVIVALAKGESRNFEQTEKTFGGETLRLFDEAYRNKFHSEPDADDMMYDRHAKQYIAALKAANVGPYADPIDYTEVPCAICGIASITRALGDNKTRICRNCAMEPGRFETTLMRMGEDIMEKTRDGMKEFDALGVVGKSDIDEDVLERLVNDIM